MLPQAIVGFHHRQAWRVYWFFPSTDAGTLDRYVCYNYRAKNHQGRWTYGEKTVSFAFEYLEPGLSYDDLGTYYLSYDDLPDAPYETAFLTEGTFKPAVVADGASGTANVVSKLEGVGGTAKLTTNFFAVDDERLTEVTRVRPRFRVAPTTGTQTHCYANEPDEMSLRTSIESMSMADGAFDHVWEARWHQFKQTFTGDMELLGWHITMRPGSEE